MVLNTNQSIKLTITMSYILNIYTVYYSLAVNFYEIKCIVQPYDTACSMIPCIHVL